MRPLRLIRFVQLVVLALLLTVCGLPGGLSTVLPNPVSPNGARISQLYDQISIPAIFIFLLVEALLLWVVLRYRRSRQPAGYVPPQTHGNTTLEITWTIIPLRPC